MPNIARADESPPITQRGEGRGELLAGIAIGGVLAIPIVVFTLKLFESFAGEIARFFVYLALALLVISGLIYIFARAIIRRATQLTGDFSLNTILNDFKAGVSATLAGDKTGATSQLGDAVSNAALWFIWIQGRRWIVTLILGAIALFAGSAGTLILIMQNEILEQQKELLGGQSRMLRDTMLAQDAAKSTPLYAQLVEVLIAIEQEASKRGTLKPWEQVELSPELSQRIAFLSESFKPYWYFDTYSGYSRSAETLTADLPMVYLSPERGQLLKALIGSRAVLYGGEESSAVYAANFRNADMRGTRIWGFHHGSTWSVGAIDYGGDCGTASTPYSMYSPAQVPKFERESAREGLVDTFAQPKSDETRLYALDLTGYDLTGSDFSYADFNGVMIQDNDGSLKFYQTALTSVRVHTDTKFDISGSYVYAIVHEPRDGVTLPEIIAKGTKFVGRLCYPGEDTSEILDKNADSEISANEMLQRQITLKAENFRNALFNPELWQGRLTMLKINRDSPVRYESADTHNDMVLYPLENQSPPGDKVWVKINASNERPAS